MEKVIKLGFLGLGVVGTRLLTMILENQGDILKNYGIRFEIGAILVRDINKMRKIEVEGFKLTVDENDILKDDTINICIECMGGSGSERTKEIVLQALNKKKHIIMSSKKCLAKYSTEIFEAAERNQCQIRFEATVGGGIPICSTLRSMAKGEEIVGIYGILNATSNYILSVINEENISYEEAVHKAKEKGYAENDSSEDVDGWDAAYKLGILMNIGMGVCCDFNQLEPESIHTVQPSDIMEAKKKDEIVKQIAYAKKNENGYLTYYIGPCKIKKDSFFASVKGNNNMIFTEGKSSGIRAFYGQGAGAGPTASVMFDDLIDILQNNYRYHPSRFCGKISKEKINLEF